MKVNKRLLKENNGITLIALVVTIIVILILAAISITMIMGDTGLIERAEKTKAESIIGQEKEQIGQAYSAALINKLGEKVSDVDLQNELNMLVGYSITKVSKSTDELLKVYYNTTKHLYTVLITTGEIIYSQTSESDFSNDPIIDVSTTYILRASGKLSTYTLVGKERDYEEYDPIESNETVIGENPKEIGDGYYIDKDNNLHLLGKDLIINDVKNVDNGRQFALTNDGKLYLWGYNYYGKIGNGTRERSDEPVCINNISGNALFGKNIVSAGIDEGCYAIDSDGKAYTWGTAHYGEGVLGNGTTEMALEPICISDIPNSPIYQKRIKNMYIGEHNSWAIDEQGKLYIWGYNYDGQIGNGRHGRNFNSNLPICVSDITTSALYNKKIKTVSVTFDVSWAIDEDGKLYTWGTSWVVKLGANMTDNSSYNYLPVSVSTIPESPLYNKIIKSAYLSNYACYALDEDGKIYTWGYNNDGVTGTGTTGEVYMPVCLNDVENSEIYGKTINDAYSDFFTMYAIDEQGKKYAWGENYTNVPQEIRNESSENIKKMLTVYSDYRYEIYLETNGKIYINSERHIVG